MNKEKKMLVLTQKKKGNQERMLKWHLLMLRKLWEKVSKEKFDILEKKSIGKVVWLV
jgi:hypothetical protein